MAKRESTRKSKKTTKTSRTETSTKSKGLGDTIEKITTATGIKAAVKAVVGDECGCDERKEKLNKLFPYKREPECLNEEEIAYLSTGVLKKKTLTYDDRVQIATIHARVFHHKFDVPCTCSPKIWMQWVKQLQLLLDENI
jgi:BRCT domain type II-containing protein